MKDAVTMSGAEHEHHQLALPRAAVRLLAACAASDRLCPELGLGDETASALFAQLGGSLDSFGRGELRCAAFRAALTDRVARDFFQRHPSGIGVALWPILGTRAHRLGGRWLELDAPPVAALRERYLPARAGRAQSSSCLCQAAQVGASTGGPGPRLFVLDESVLPLCAGMMERALDSLCAHAPSGSELLITFDAASWLQPAPGRSQAALALELVASDHVARYPRLRFVDAASYDRDLRESLQGLSAASVLSRGTPGLAHVRVGEP